MVSSSSENNAIQKGRLERDGLKKQYAYHRVIRTACPKSSSSPSQIRKVMPFPAGLCPACAGTAAGHSFRLRLYGSETFLVCYDVNYRGCTGRSQVAQICIKLLWGNTFIGGAHPEQRKKSPSCTQFSCKPGVFLIFSPRRGRQVLPGQGSSHMPQACSDWQE